jgi:hypothetical protein
MTAIDGTRGESMPAQNLPAIQIGSLHAARRLAIEFVLLATWMVAVLSGLWWMNKYQTTPGSIGQTPRHLPAQIAGNFAAGRDCLLMFVHPKCPCSRASLSQFAEIVAQNRDRVSAAIVFVKPPGVSEGWERSFLWDSAKKMAGVQLLSDDGTLARELGSETSGHVVLYDAAGRLLFTGGITRSRGHEGESVGGRAVCALLRGESTPDTTTPVFGCPLFAAGQCKQPKPTVSIGAQEQPCCSKIR